jgi:hypothetical protein
MGIWIKDRPRPSEDPWRRLFYVFDLWSSFFVSTSGEAVVLLETVAKLKRKIEELPVEMRESARMESLVDQLNEFIVGPDPLRITNHHRFNLELNEIIRSSYEMFPTSERRMIDNVSKFVTK